MQFDIVVIIPGLEVTEVHLNHAYAAFDQAARHQTAASEIVTAVPLTYGLRFLRDIERVRCFGLHAERNLSRLNARLKLSIFTFTAELQTIEPAQQIQFP